MPEIIENHAPQWNEQTLLKRMQLIERKPDVALLPGELPLSVCVPNLVAHSKKIFAYAKRNNLTEHSKSMSAIGGIVYAETSPDITYMKLLENTLNEFSSPDSNLVMQCNADIETHELESHLVLRTKGTIIDPKQVQRDFLGFKTLAIQEAKKDGFNMQVNTISNARILLEATRRVWMQYVQKYHLAYYCAVDSDSLHLVKDATVN